MRSHILLTSYVSPMVSGLLWTKFTERTVSSAAKGPKERGLHECAL